MGVKSKRNEYSDARRVGPAASKITRCVIVAAMLSILLIWIVGRVPSDRLAPSFTLMMRTRDPAMFAPEALKHYAKCPGVGAVRVIKDHSASWNLTRAYLAVSNGAGHPGHGGYSLDDVKEELEHAALPARWVDRLDARTSSGGAVLLVSDDLLLDCDSVTLAFETWRNNGHAIVGTLALGHVLRPESGRHAWLDYKVSVGVNKHGMYSMVSLNGAFVSMQYLRQAAEGQSSVRSSHTKAGACDEIWLNHMVALTTGQPPLFVRARFHNARHVDFSSQASDYYDGMSKCLSRLASGNAGKLNLIWASSMVAAGDLRMGQGAYSSDDPSVPQTDSFPMVDDFGSSRRRYLMASDRLAGVSVVLVMGTRPTEVSSAVRHLHTRHSFIREAVVWNNKNETMNHHMFPYDIALRYVMAPKNYAAYSRYLGCMLARHEICYFQHERTRPLFLAGLFAAFLARPDVIVAASDPNNAFIARINMTFYDASGGRLAGFADVEEGAMVHKDLVRQFVQRMSADGSRSFHERAADADMYFTFSQPTLPMVLTHTTRTNNKARVFPAVHRISKALAFTFEFAPSSEPMPEFSDPASQRHLHFKAPCATSNCAFMTSIDAWPKPAVTNFGQDKKSLKPSRYYAEVINRDIDNATRPDALNSTLHYYRAVDDDLKTSWQVDLPSKPSFIGLELLAPKTIVGVKLWCKHAFEPMPTLKLGFYGHDGYEQSWCTSNWTKEGSLNLLHYKCPPLRVHRVRLIINTYEQRLDIAELTVDKLDSTIIQAAEAFKRYEPSLQIGASLTDLPTPPKPPTAPSIGKVLYVLQGDPVDFCRGQSLAMLEEACELGVLYPGKIKLLYVGDSPKTSLQTFARIFAVVGSTCSLENSVKFEAVHPPIGGGATSIAMRNARRFEVYEWWLKSNLDARVVFFDPHNSPLTFVLRSMQASSPTTVFVARSTRIDDGAGEGTALAHATTMSSKKDYVRQAKGPRNWDQDRRIVYPLRTLQTRPPLLETPTIPAIEEVVVLVTPATTSEDMELFNSHALPILQQRADVRLANITALSDEIANHGGADEADDLASADTRVKRPKWSTLRDVAHYVAIYPARVLWVLDSSVGAAYYASLASLEAARFIAAPAAIPHWESRLLAWNATCEWTPEGFAGKARELLRGRYDASSSFADRNHLQQEASDVVVEEWPIKRIMAPFVNTVTEIASYLAELVSAHEIRAAYSLE